MTTRSTMMHPKRYPRRVLHVFKCYAPEREGGVIRVIDALATGMARHGIESRVLTLGPQEGTSTQSGYRVTRVAPRLRLGDLCMPWGLRRALREQISWADLVHYHMPWPIPVIAATGLRQRYVITHHADLDRHPLIDRIHDRFMASFYRRAAKVIATSAEYARRSSLLVGSRCELALAPIGIAPDPESMAGPTSTGLDCVSFVGVFRRYKSLEVLVEAVAGLPCKVVLAGDGPAMPKVRAAAERAGADNVTFTGHVSESEKRALMRRSTIFVLPSAGRGEAFGVCLLEAARAGVPMITCNPDSGSAFVNKHRVTGIVTKPNDPDALRKAILEILEDKAMQRRMGAAARARFLELFTAERMVARYIELYAEALG